MSERAKPHENLLSTSSYSLNRAIELLPPRDAITDAELVDLAQSTDAMISTLTTLSEAIKAEQQRRAEA